MRKLRQIFWQCMRSSLLVLVMGLLLALVYARIEHVRLLAVQTSSMLPVFAPKDAVLIAPRPTSQLAVGDIVAYKSPLISNQLVTHRIISLDIAHQSAVTKGDGLQQADPPLRLQSIVGQEIAVLPHGGAILTFLQRPIGLMVLLYIPAASIIIGEYRHLQRHYARRCYRLQGSRMV